MLSSLEEALLHLKKSAAPHFLPKSALLCLQILPSQRNLLKDYSIYVKETKASEEAWGGKGTFGSHLTQPLGSSRATPRPSQLLWCPVPSSLALASERPQWRGITPAVLPHPRDATGHSPFLNQFHSLSFTKHSAFLCRRPDRAWWHWTLACLLPQSDKGGFHLVRALFPLLDPNLQA